MGAGRLRTMATRAARWGDRSLTRRFAQEPYAFCHLIFLRERRKSPKCAMERDRGSYFGGISGGGIG